MTASGADSRQYLAGASEPPPRPSRDPRQVFISHARQDNVYAHRLAADLKAAGWRVWIAPDSIPPGTKWADAIETGLESSTFFAVVLTPAAIRSRWVRTEINMAISLEHRGQMQVIPLDVETCDGPLLLSGYQYISCAAGYESGLQALLERLPRVEPVADAARRPTAAEAAVLPPLGAGSTETKQAEKPSVGKALPTPSPAPAHTSFQVLTIDHPLQMEFVYVPEGAFLMGSDPAEDPLALEDEMPQHRVHLRGHYIGRYPVTNAQYAVFVEATHRAAPEHWMLGTIPVGREEHPVVCVSWADAVAFCAWLSETSKVTARLPTEAEWEKAARGTDGRVYPWGNDEPDEALCHYNMGRGNTTSVKEHEGGVSPYGALDMAGNAFEWTSSLYRSYPYRADDGREGPGSQARVMRGGAFASWSGGVRCACRGWFDPFPGAMLIGFRVVADALPGAEIGSPES